jgi:hypothetical protein
LPFLVTATGTVPSAVSALPTARQEVADVQETPDKVPSAPPGGVGPVDADQVVPARVSMRGKYR